MAGTAILAGALAYGATALDALPGEPFDGHAMLVFSPYALLGGFAATVVFALAALLAGLARR